MKVALNSSVSIEGTPTAGQITEFLSAFPTHASVEIRTWDSQRDGHGTAISVTWEEER